MTSEKINSQKKDNNKSQTIVCLGSSLNLELTLSLDENQYESIGINYKEITKIDDIKNLFRYKSPLSSLKLEKLTSLIELKSNNFLFNSILFINQSCAKKINIKYLIPFSPKFSKELNFIYDITKIITETNNIFIEDSNILDIKPNIVFTLKLIDKDNIIIDQKSFLITNENHYNNKNEENKKDDKLDEYNGELFEGLNFKYDCDYFYTSISELFNCKKNSENEIDTFFKKLINKYPDVKICINYDENYLLNNKDFILKLFNITDIFIFEKKDVINFYNNLFNEEKDENKEKKNDKKNLLEEFFIYKIKTEKNNQKIKIGIFINDLKEMFLIQQDPKTNLILFQSKQNINIIPTISNEYHKKQYEELITLKYNSIKSVYIGAFLNRLIRQKSFENCLNSSLKCCIKYLNILKFDLDVPSIQNYYEIKNNKIHKKKINKEEIKNKLLENKFVLDCTNLNNKTHIYNSLYDENCVNFFNSKETRKHLQKQGFINKKGMILIDPEKNKDIFCTFSKKDKKDIFKNLQNKFYNIKEIRRNNDNMKDKLTQISLINQSSLKKYSFRDFDSINNDNSSYRNFYLPKIKNKNASMNKTPSIFKKYENLYRENHKEDIKKFFGNRKKNLSEMNFNNKIKKLNPIKYNKKYYVIDT